jgi:phospholipase/lecithinase/hemolysin
METRSIRAAAFATAIAAVSLTISSAVLAREKPQELVIFGDSLSDTGSRFLDEGSMYTFWDAFHPTATVHEIIGQAAIAAMSD